MTCARVVAFWQTSIDDESSTSFDKKFASLLGNGGASQFYSCGECDGDDARGDQPSDSVT